MVERISGVGDLSAVGRYLDDSSAALFAQMRDRGADEGDRTTQIRVEDAVDFIKGQFFSCPKEAVAGVAHINIDAAVLRGGFVHFFSHLDGVRDIQNHAVKCVRVLLNQVGNLLRGADGADDTVTCRKKLFSHFTTKAA